MVQEFQISICLKPGNDLFKQNVDLNKHLLKIKY